MRNLDHKMTKKKNMHNIVDFIIIPFNCFNITYLEELLHASESARIEQRPLPANLQSGMEIHAQDVQLWMSLDREPRERREPRGQRRQLGHVPRTLEPAQQGRGVAADVELVVGPVARAAAPVEHESHVARGDDGLSEGALVVRRLARVDGEDAELVGASGGRDGGVVRRTVVAVDRPVEGAVVVGGAGVGGLRVEEEAVLAGLVGQGAVGALVEVVAGLGIMVDL